MGVGPVTGAEGRGGVAGWRVFVSHTSELRDFPSGKSYLAEVERAISAAGHVIVDMADFPAADQTPAQLCVERVGGVRFMWDTGHPVRISGSRLAGSVVYGAGVRHCDQGGLDRLVFLLDTDAEDVGIPAVELIDRRVRDPPGRVPAPGANQRANHAVLCELGYARAASGTFTARASPNPVAHPQRDRPRTDPAGAAAAADVEVRQPAAGGGTKLVSGSAGRDGPASPVCGRSGDRDGDRHRPRRDRQDRDGVSVC